MDSDIFFTTIIADIAVTIGIIFAIFELVSYRIAHKCPLINLAVPQLDANDKSHPDACMHSSYEMYDINGNKKDVTIYFKWLILNNNNRYGTISILKLKFDNFICTGPVNYIIPKHKDWLNQWHVPIIHLPCKISAGDTLQGYFPFVSHKGHVSPIKGHRDLLIYSSRGKSKIKPIKLTGDTVYGEYAKLRYGEGYID